MPPGIRNRSADKERHVDHSRNVVFHNTLDLKREMDSEHPGAFEKAEGRWQHH